MPGALIGVDIEEMLSQAIAMADACRAEIPDQNPGALLGTAIGEAALAGRDKLTLCLPDEMASFSDWVEQLLAESTGKLGKGIVPIVGEPAAPSGEYGDDRTFVVLGPHPNAEPLEAAGHPVIRLDYTGKQQLGAEFFRWEFATAVAGQRLGINAFDQPNVQSAKDATSHILEAGITEAEKTPPLRDVLAGASPGDYIALLAYLPPQSGERDAVDGAAPPTAEALQGRNDAGVWPSLPALHRPAAQGWRQQRRVLAADRRSIGRRAHTGPTV